MLGIHPIHLTPEQRALEEMRQGMKQLNERLSGAQTVTLQGAPGQTPQKGVDFLTPQEVESLKIEIGNLVLNYVLPQIRQPLDGKTPIPGIDFPTPEQIYTFAEAAIQKIKTKDLNRQQVAKEVVEILKKDGNFFDTKNLKIDWRNIKNKPDFDRLMAEIGGGGGSTLRIQDEGATVSEHVTTLNFVGSGVSSSYQGNGVIVITVAGSAGNFASNETPSGTVDGANDTFTLANTPSPAGSLQLYVNGQLQTAGGVDYTLSGATVTFVTVKIPVSGDIIRCWYQYA